MLPFAVVFKYKAVNDSRIRDNFIAMVIKALVICL